MKSVIVAAVLALTQNDPVPAQKPSAAQAAVDADQACLKEAASRLDDGLSDAATIVSGLETECFAHIEKIIDATVAETPNLRPEFLRDILQQAQPKWALKIVLQERRARKTPR
jgi:phosphoenolpyruvate-protein kinase (PTS system EI component)